MHKLLLPCAVFLSRAFAAAVLEATPSSVPYGAVIYGCTRPGVVALTFDDGPYTYTEELLDSLAASGQGATFFVNGRNWDSISNHASSIQRMVAEGHQVASHTWGHADLTTLDAASIRSDMERLDEALLDIIGRSPQYMRIPYFNYNNDTLQTLGSLGYHVIDRDIETLDWQYATADTIDASYELYESRLDAGGTVSLMHDVHPTTIQILVPRVLNLLAQRGIRSVPVGECLGDDPANWYRIS